MSKPTLIAAEPVSAYVAKTHLPKLLERTARGERFVITRHGKPVAQLIPFEGGDHASVHQAIDKVASIRNSLQRKGVTLSAILEDKETPRGLAHAGHRY
jgi:prevent-host-death family protein